MIKSAAVRNLFALLYGAGILILADQAADLAATLLANAPSPSAAPWRFGVFGLLMSRVSVFLVADVMLWSAALGMEHRSVIRTLGLLHLLMAGVVFAGLVVFALDWLQVRGRVQAERTQGFDLAALRAILIALLLTGVSVWAGRLAFKGWRSRGRQGADPTPLVSVHRPDLAP